MLSYHSLLLSPLSSAPAQYSTYFSRTNVQCCAKHAITASAYPLNTIPRARYCANDYTILVEQAMKLWLSLSKLAVYQAKKGLLLGYIQCRSIMILQYQLKLNHFTHTHTHTQKKLQVNNLATTLLITTTVFVDQSRAIYLLASALTNTDALETHRRFHCDSSHRDLVQHSLLYLFSNISSRCIFPFKPCQQQRSILY